MLGPFLCRTIYAVFLSYPSQLEDLARQIRGGLEQVGQREKSRVVIRDRRELDSEEKNSIGEYHNFCSIQLEGDEVDEKYRADLSTWEQLRDKGRERQRRCFKLIVYKGRSSARLVRDGLVVSGEQAIPEQIGMLFGLLSPGRWEWI